MIISDTEKFVFIHNPKVGGMTFRTALLQRHPPPAEPAPTEPATAAPGPSPLPSPGLLARLLAWLRRLAG